MSTIVLAYSGGFASSNAVHWLTEKYGADVVTVTLDVGQGDDLGASRARALSCGAVRAHAIDAREELVREFLLPSLVRGPLSEGPGIAEFTRPLIARKLLEVARIEGASIVAHASLDESLDAAIRALDPRVEILAPARVWKMDATELSDYARMHGVPPTALVRAAVPDRSKPLGTDDQLPRSGWPAKRSPSQAALDVERGRADRPSVRGWRSRFNQRRADASCRTGRKPRAHRRRAWRWTTREHQQRAHGRLRRPSGHGAPYGSRSAG